MFRVSCGRCDHMVKIGTAFAKLLAKTGNSVICWCCQPEGVRESNRKAWKRLGWDLRAMEHDAREARGCGL